MRGLIKHEIRNIWGITLGFLAITAVILMGLNEQFTWAFRRYLLGWSVEAVTFSNIFNGNELIFMSCMIAGIVLLVIFQFREHKNIATGNFLASLPYTHKQIYSVKLVMGVLTYTLSFLVYMVVVILNWRGNIGWLTEIERIASQNVYVQSGNNLGDILIGIIVMYGIVTVVYFFLCLMQYIISNCIGSIVISGLILASFPYMRIGIGAYIEEYFGSSMVRNILSSIDSLFINFFMFYDVTVVQIQGGPEGDTYIHYSNIDSLMVWRLLVIITVLGLFVMGIHTISKNYGLGKQENFIVTVGFERVFKMGVTVCSILIPVWIWGLFGYLYEVKLVLAIAMIGTGIIGYFIAHKITQSGNQ